MKKVIVISTSLRRGSNSDMLVDKFVEGAKIAVIKDLFFINNPNSKVQIYKIC